MINFKTIKLICAVCKKQYGSRLVEKLPVVFGIERDESHGYCEDCRKIESEKIKKYKEVSKSTGRL